MGQKLKDDKIGSLSHSSGTISLTASTLTIGGQQYVVSSLSRLISSDVTLVANTLYMIYAVVSSGVVVMRISTNVNSVGPAGFTSWKLVGAFYSNGLASVAFGSFVTIDGVPTSGEILHNCIPTIPGGTNPTKGTTSTDRFVYVRRGNIAFCRHEYIQTAPGTAGSGGNGQYYWSLPFNIDTNNFGLAGGNGYQVNGNTFIFNNSVSGFYGAIQPQDVAGNFRYITTTAANIQGTGSYALNVSGHQQGARFEFPVTGWLNTPLKDL